VRCPDTELYELDLVGGEQKVGDPNRPSGAIQVPRDHVICGWRNCGQSRRANHLCRRTGVSTGPFYDRLCKEGGARRGANPKYARIPPAPKKPDRRHQRRNSQSQRSIPHESDFIVRAGPYRSRPHPAFDGSSQQKQTQDRDD